MANSFLGFGSGSGTIWELLTNPLAAWDHFRNGAANDTNKEINEENVELQRETNAQNETLMREQWAREDSTYQRTVADMNAAGINPLAMTSTNGAGQVVANTAPQKTLGAESGGPIELMQTLLDAKNQKDSLKTEKEISDAQIKLEEEKLKFEKQKLATSHEETVTAQIETARHNKASENEFSTKLNDVKEVLSSIKEEAESRGVTATVNKAIEKVGEVKAATVKEKINKAIEKKNEKELKKEQKAAKKKSFKDKWNNFWHGEHESGYSW